MGVFVLNNALVTINAVDLSTRATSVTINYEREAVESTAFGSGGRTFVAGLENNSCDVELQQDLATSMVEATIFPIVGTSVTLILRNDAGAVAATNPTYTITGAYLATHTPLNAGVGEMGTTSLSFQGGTLVKTTA